MNFKIIFSAIALTFTIHCTAPQPKNDTPQNNMTPLTEPHSQAQFQEAKTTHLTLDLTANFDKKILHGSATHKIENNQASQIIFDTKNLTIEKVSTNDLPSTSFTLSEEDKILGQALVVDITPKTTEVTIHYQTSPHSEAVQWLSPQQTGDKTHPFLFTQGEAILTRSWIPIQDSPGNKITYHASITVPDSLTAVMSAKTTQQMGNTFHFELNQPIPCYLIALAIGKLEYQSLGNRSGVYAEPGMIKAATHEFQEVEEMITAAENLYGPYQWEQYDIIVLPPSFPFGGMENPRLTFATPTIITGDRSLTALIAHELAHSWSGNLVTNATWNDFWLNEGFTVYFENRITEALYGKDYADMLAVLGFQELQKTIQKLPAEDTQLKLNLAGRNPDDGMTDIAYEKGHFFLKTIENQVGREKMDAFLKEYFQHHQFKNITTEEFVEYLHQHLPETQDLNVKEWIYQPGLPENCVKPISKNFEAVNAIFNKYGANIHEVKEKITPWTTHEWLHYLRSINENWTLTDFETLDKHFLLTQSTNSEIAAIWYEKSILAKYKAVYPQLEEFLTHVGRRKFLVPLYQALLQADDKPAALKIYQKARPNYHFVSTHTIDDLLNY